MISVQSKAELSASERLGCLGWGWTGIVNPAVLSVLERTQPLVLG